MNKLLGYRYTIHEMYPVEDGDGISKALICRDNIVDIQTILDALNSTDVDLTVYVIIAQPVFSS